jgi:predicted methyltransferase
MNHQTISRSVTLGICLLSAATALAQKTSVKPGINDSFRNPSAEEFTGRFEVESREVYARRSEIVAACKLKPGMTVADIGAGTGLFTRLFAKAVEPGGKVVAVDIAQNFLDHIEKSAHEGGLKNIETVLASGDSTGLAPESVDFAFICDTYHHFEFPHKTLASLHRALKPGGRLVLIDFRRIEGQSTDWVLNHVRAGQDVFEAEIEAAGFKKVAEKSDLLQENYFVVFEKSPVAQKE